MRKAGKAVPETEEEYEALEERLIHDHIEKYKGFHPNTLKQIRFLTQDVKGALTPEQSAVYSRLPNEDDMCVIKVDPGGKCEFTLPKGAEIYRCSPLVQPIPAEDFLKNVAETDPHTKEKIMKWIEGSKCLNEGKLSIGCSEPSQPLMRIAEPKTAQNRSTIALIPESL